MTVTGARTVATLSVARPDAYGPLPQALERVAAQAAEQLAGPLQAPTLAALVTDLLPRTWRTCLRPAATPGLFVVTGDIPAMWLRDAAGQLRPYLAAADDPTVADALVAAVRRMSGQVLTDPYANAFNDGPTGAHPEQSDLPAPRPEVWERKYEVDSLASYLAFAYEVWATTGRTDHLDADFHAGARTVVELWQTEQDHPGRSSYTFLRPEGEFSFDSLPDDGRGAPVAPTGMTWSGFRPSDDRCELGYLVPANAAAVVALEGLVHLAAQGLVPADLAAPAEQLAVEIAQGIVRHGVVQTEQGSVYAYEVDGLGGAVLMDDANVPSLLSLPYLGWTHRDDPLYQRTRAFVLGPQNPFWYKGSAAHGVGSPHTPVDHVWPIALAMESLTASTPEQARDPLERLLGAWVDEPGMCESFHVEDPQHFTREWFCWADSLVTEAALALTDHPVPRALPPRLPGVAAVQREAGLLDRDATGALHGGSR